MPPCLAEVPALADDLLARIRPAEDGWGHVVGETQAHLVRVVPMLINDRIVVQPKDDLMFVERYWCYRPGGAAVLAALALDSETACEPVGWIKAWDGRYGADAPYGAARRTVSA